MLGLSRSVVLRVRHPLDVAHSVGPFSTERATGARDDSVSEAVDSLALVCRRVLETRHAPSMRINAAQPRMGDEGRWCRHRTSATRPVLTVRCEAKGG